MQSELAEDATALKEAAQRYYDEHKKTDKFCNSPVRSKFLSQNYLDNYLLVEALCKNLKFSLALTRIVFCGLRLSLDAMQVLNEALLKNRVVKDLALNFCLLDAPLLEALMPCFCQNQSLETLDLSCNALDDRVSYLVAKIVSGQSERRDLVVWSYALRGEQPPDDQHKQGLKQLILAHNNFADSTASELVLALRNDLHMRSVDLRNNQVSERWCSEFARLMTDNRTLTNVDLRLNPGFSQKTHRELALGLLRNIQDLKAKGELESLDESVEIKSKFVRSEVLTVEIPKKCKLHSDNS